MISFRQALQQRVTDICRTSIGTDIRTYDKYLHDVELTALPFLVVTVRTAETTGAGEIGTSSDLWSWVVHLYYLDTADTYDVGEDRRDNILARIERTLEKDKRLGNLELTDPVLGREYVWNTSITAVLFDYTGQEGYHSFVSELYLNVATAKS